MTSILETALTQELVTLHYIILLYLPSDFRAPYAVVISEHLTIDHVRGRPPPTLYALLRPTGGIMSCETGPTVCRPYPRRLESLTI